MYRLLLTACLVLTYSSSYGYMDIGTVSDNIVFSFKNIAYFMIATAFLMGLGLGIASIFKFKQHKDNPTQVPIGTPIVMLFLSAGLVFLPGIYHPLGISIFNDTDVNKYTGGFSGESSSTMPGYLRYQS